ncbi:MAG: Hsp20/alpha crystallin family protein [Alphaproteobacteria bacterium]|nr:Hsp20/alpha crystallin family protein [Alphaproteobacteria bacterium]
MNKLILPVIALACMLAPNASFAQVEPMHEMVDTIFNTMKKMEAKEFFGPKMDIMDLGEKIEVKAELSGIDEKDINLSVEDGVLTISGERKLTVAEDEQDYYMREISVGSFSRSITLPKNIDESKAEAIFKNGMLTIYFPKVKAREDNSRKIPIKVEN